MRLNGLSITEAAKWGKTPTIQKKADQTVKKVMTDEFVARLEEHAKRDAKAGIYMSDVCAQERYAHMQKYVSPDRAGPMTQVSSIFQDIMKDQDSLLKLLDKLLGNASAKVCTSNSGYMETAEIYSSDGEMIAAYNCLGGGWTSVQTKAETKFLSEAAAVYAKAYKEARAKIQDSNQNCIAPDLHPKLDVIV